MKKKTKIIFFIILFFVIISMSVVVLSFCYFSSVELNLKGEKNYTINYGEEYKEYGAVAKIMGKDYTTKVKIDNSNLNLSKIGKYTIIYKLNLLFGKSRIVKRTVKVVDNISPQIELINGNYITVDYGNSYVEPGYKIKDNYDDKDNITVNITYDKEINPNIIGEYNIFYEAIDTSGNSSTVKRTVAIKPYERIKIVNGVTYIDGVLIANKKYYLPSSYNPGINKEAYNQLVIMQNAAINHGYSLPLISGFRTYWDQKSIYNNYVSIYGVELTDTFSARPGSSEHQTGLAFDIGAIDDNFGNYPEGIWLKNNAHLYGFIIRYPYGKQHITGYKYEPWHVRYLGVDLATKVYNSGLSLEEYLNI